MRRRSPPRGNGGRPAVHASDEDFDNQMRSMKRKLVACLFRGIPVETAGVIGSVFCLNIPVDITLYGLAAAIPACTIISTLLKRRGAGP